MEKNQVRITDLDFLRREPRSLEKIPKPTPEECWVAVRNDGLALEFVPPELRSTAMVLAALKENKEAIRHVFQLSADLIRALRITGRQEIISLFDQIRYQRGAQVRSWAALNPPDRFEPGPWASNAVRAMEG